MTATIHHITPRRVHHPFRAPASITHGTRDPARPASSVGRAVDFDRHRQTCETCRCTPCVCDQAQMPRFANVRDGKLLPPEPINWRRKFEAFAMVFCALAVVLSVAAHFAATFGFQ